MTNNKAIISLLLLVPAPSVGVLAGMVFWPDTMIGNGIFMLSKIWLFALPSVWHKFVDKEQLSLSPAKKGGFRFGLFSGEIIGVIIVTAYLLFAGTFIKEGQIADKMAEIGLDNRWVYLGGAIYWICVNSVLEEYVWRWFVTKQCRQVVGPAAAAAVSAGCFTMHHAIALSTFMPVAGTVICSAGIFIGGTLWSWMYIKYGSIWPGYISHAIVDLVIFGIGAWIVFC